MRFGPRATVNGLFGVRPRPLPPTEASSMDISEQTLPERLRNGVVHRLLAGLAAGVVHLLREGVLQALKLNSLGTVSSRDGTVLST